MTEYKRTSQILDRKRYLRQRRISLGAAINALTLLFYLVKLPNIEVQRSTVLMLSVKPFIHRFHNPPEINMNIDKNKSYETGDLFRITVSVTNFISEDENNEADIYLYIRNISNSDNHTAIYRFDKDGIHDSLTSESIQIRKSSDEEILPLIIDCTIRTKGTYKIQSEVKVVRKIEKFIPDNYRKTLFPRGQFGMETITISSVSEKDINIKQKVYVNESEADQNNIQNIYDADSN